jgi:hypothetical protein
VDVTGFYYLYNRYYDPVAGQWVSFDPMPNDRDPNGQRFCGGDSINYFDPDGRLGKQTIRETEADVAFVDDQVVNLGFGMGELANRAAYLATGQPNFKDQAQFWQSHMSPYARQGWYNPNTPTARLATAVALVVMPESAPGRVGMVESAFTRNTVKAAETTAARTASGDFYSVAFETKLAPTSYPGVSRYMHFKEANTALDAEMQSNPLLSELGISVPKSPTDTILGKPPTDWAWHHDAEAGVMQLVPKIQHPNIPGGIFWDTMHPGGVEGFSIWGQ